MPSVTVYSNPGCQPCKATERALKRLNIDYVKVDLSTDPEALEYVKSKGYSAAPVVQVGDDIMWSGYRDDLINNLVTA